MHACHSLLSDYWHRFSLSPECDDVLQFLWRPSCSSPPFQPPLLPSSHLPLSMLAGFCHLHRPWSVASGHRASLESFPNVAASHWNEITGGINAKKRNLCFHGIAFAAIGRGLDRIEEHKNTQISDALQNEDGNTHLCSSFSFSALSFIIFLFAAANFLHSSSSSCWSALWILN